MRQATMHIYFNKGWELLQQFIFLRNEHQIDDIIKSCRMNRMNESLYPILGT